jgi:hypothetical protein
MRRYRAALPLSRQTLSYVAGVIRRALPAPIYSQRPPLRGAFPG